MKPFVILKKRQLVIYFGLLILWILLLLTGYSFSFKPLNTVLMLLILCYPVFIFFRSAIRTWIKLIIGLLFVSSIIIFGWNIPVILAFSHESTLNDIKEWHLSNYRITLKKKAGWAGPPYLEFELSRHRFLGIVKKNIGVSYPHYKQTNPCELMFTEDIYHESAIYKFDTCKVTLERLE